MELTELVCAPPCFVQKIGERFLLKFRSTFGTIKSKGMEAIHPCLDNKPETAFYARKFFIGDVKYGCF